MTRLLALMSLLLGGCVTSTGVKVPIVVAGSENMITPAFVAADEPLAVQVGRAVLEAGGSAVDAATAVGLVMTVTLPSRVGPGGGGFCVVHDPQNKRVRTLDFTPRRVQAAGGAGRELYAPSFVRGLSALHAAHGRERWEQLVVAAETQAIRGISVSHALAADLAAVGARLDPSARARFAPRGRVLTEGETLEQPELAQLLGRIRRIGPTAFYGGPGGGESPKAVAAFLGLDPSVLQGVTAQWRDAINTPNGNDVIYFPDVSADSESGGDVGRRLASLWNSSERGKAGTESVAPFAGVVALDSYEQSAACLFSQGALFGSGRFGAEAGFFSGAAWSAAQTGAQTGGVALIANPHLNSTLFAGVGNAGGLIETIRNIRVREQLPVAAIDAMHAAFPDHRVHALACRTGSRDGRRMCEAAADPLGRGVSAMVLQP